VLKVVDLPEPHAGPGEIRIRVRAAGGNPADTLLRSGVQAWALDGVPGPYVPGMDVAGTGGEIGPGTGRAPPGGPARRGRGVGGGRGEGDGDAVPAGPGRRPAVPRWRVCRARRAPRRVGGPGARGDGSRGGGDAADERPDRPAHARSPRPGAGRGPRRDRGRR